MIAKIYKEKGHKQKEWWGDWRRGITLARIVLHHNKNFRGAYPKRERNDKSTART
jgi:hypothetical protein